MYRRDGERGAAVVDFVLISLIFFPLVLGIIQLCLFLHVRNTLVACAQEGARKAANFDATLEDGRKRTYDCVAGALNPKFAEDIRAIPPHGNPPAVEMRIKAVMPPLGFFMSVKPGAGFVGVELPVSGHAVDEPEPGP